MPDLSHMQLSNHKQYREHPRYLTCIHMDSRVPWQGVGLVCDELFLESLPNPQSAFSGRNPRRSHLASEATERLFGTTEHVNSRSNPWCGYFALVPLYRRAGVYRAMT